MEYHNEMVFMVDLVIVCFTLVFFIIILHRMLYPKVDICSIHIISVTYSILYRASPDGLVIYNIATEY